VRKWAETAQREIIVLEDGDTRVGPARSFGRLLARSDAPYFAFCDQDDFWHSSKVERLLHEVQTLEATYGADTPLLAHCDLEIVDAELNPTGKSLWRDLRISIVYFGKANPDKRARSGLLLQNVVTGCATLGNADLRQRATPLPDKVHVHDWWVTLIAAHLGVIIGVSEPLVKYRQHSANTIGASAWGPWSVLKRFFAAPVASVQKISTLLNKLQRQAKGFSDAFGDQIEETDNQALLEFATLPQQGFIKRKTFMARHSIYPQSKLRGLLFLGLI